MGDIWSSAIKELMWSNALGGGGDEVGSVSDVLESPGPKEAGLISLHQCCSNAVH
jgi:hypothetical protein